MSAGRWLLAAALALASAPAVAQNTLSELEVNGASDNRIDLVIMGDGYSAAEQDALLADAQATADGIFGFTPFTQYRPFFNIYAIASVSAESGSDHPTEGALVDTAFGCAFDCMGLDRLICCDDAAVFDVADSLLPEHDAVVLMVNDPEYGGSGGYYSVVSMNEWAAEVVTHEFGHSFAGLGDEYEDAYPGFVFTDVYPNVSPTAERDALKWAGFVDADTPLPTPDSAATGPLAPVGAYEGACYQSTGLYRPVSECFMRSIATGFCPVCAEALVLGYYGYVEIIDASSPVEAAVSGATGETIELSVDAVEAEPSTVAYGWSVDGTPIVNPEAALSVPIECLAPGAHTIAVDVEDATDLVLDVYDPEQLLHGSRSWTVTRTDDGAVVEDCFEEQPIDPDAGTDADTDVDTDTDADADAGADGGPETHHGADDGCGCAAAGRSLLGPSLLGALLD
jgi:hypothetical protein